MDYSATADALEQLSVFMLKNKLGEITYKNLNLKKGIENNMGKRIEKITELLGLPILVSENKCAGVGDLYCELSLKKSPLNYPATFI